MGMMDDFGAWAGRTAARNKNTINSFFSGKASAPNNSAASPQAVSLKNQVSAGLGSSIMAWFSGTPTGQKIQTSAVNQKIDSSILAVIKSPIMIGLIIIGAGYLLLRKRR